MHTFTKLGPLIRRLTDIYNLYGDLTVENYDSDNLDIEFMDVDHDATNHGSEAESLRFY